MDILAQWKRVIEPLLLPTEPDVLMAASEAESSVTEALLALRPAANIITLDLWPERKPTNNNLSSRLPFYLHTLERVFTDGSLDLVMLDHALDDFVMQLISQHEGIELTAEPTGEYSPGPRALRAYWRSGDLEVIIAPELTTLLGAFGRALRETGALILHHWVDNNDLLVGQPFDLYSSYIPLARKWMKSAGLPLHEKSIEGADSHWWLVLERTKQGT